MEQPPGGVDDLQPQDLSSSSIAAVIDLTRRGEECVLNVKAPGWETGSPDVPLPAGETQISHTTVTFSYVSRSHVFSALDQRYLEHDLDNQDDLGMRLTQEVNGEVDKCEELQEEGRRLENGQDGEEEEEEEEGSRGSEVVFLMSRKAAVAPLGIPDTMDLCSLSREYISPLDDPVSPSATSQDDVDDVFVLPQTSSSPSADASYLETPGHLAWDGLSTETAQPDPAARAEPGRDAKPARRRKAALEVLKDFVDDVSEDKAMVAVPRINGNATAATRTLVEKKLPARLGRGTRLEAIVMNINPSRFRVSRTPRPSKGSNAASETSKKNDTLQTEEKKRRRRRSRATGRRRARPARKTNGHVSKDSTSDSGIQNPNTPSPPKLPKSLSPPLKVSSPPPENHVTRTPPTSSPSPKPPKRSRVRARTRVRKRPSRQASSMFSPREPEIKLRYVTFKDEKRELRSDAFSPFVRVRRQPLSPSLCTVVNYPEEGVAPRRGSSSLQKAGGGGAFMPGAVPSSSCLTPGRVSSLGAQQRPLVCCLCGQPANAMDLGDLHGPYYPDGVLPGSKAAAAAGVTPGRQVNGDFSDSDSSSCSVRRRRGKKRAAPPPRRPPRGEGEGQQWWGGGAEGPDAPGSPASKRGRMAAGWADGEDWYSAPMLPLQRGEFWLHEDCGVWAAGVFLVRGKVYGLEEAVRAAQETMCSSCRDPGATLGCFFKGCPNKYHYRCALESDCILIEENFSMKCKKHKNKSFKAPAGPSGPPGPQWDDR